MQTFLPYSNFTSIAKCLDNKRLNKQILECDQLISLHTGEKDNSWKNHPAYKMWIGYVNALILYRNEMLAEWINRGFKNTRTFKLYGDISFPKFLNDDKVIMSHRSNLVRKLPEHYSNFGWKDYGIEGYYWPCTVKTDRSKKINKQWENWYENTVN